MPCSAPNRPVHRLLFALVALGSIAQPVRAEKTLMFMVDFFLLQQQTDTIMNLNVFQPVSEVKMVDGSAVPSFVLTDAYDTEKFGWWYALPGFDANAYVNGRIRINTLYKRGWYQNDSIYVMKTDTTLTLPDSQNVFWYRKPGALVETMMAVPNSLPKQVVLPAGAAYRGPKLYTSAGNSGTDILNMRTLGALGLPVAGTGNLDKCIDTLASDTIWIRWGTPQAPPGQNPLAANLKCFAHNPFTSITTGIRVEVPVLSRQPQVLGAGSRIGWRFDGSRDVRGRRLPLPQR